MERILKSKYKTAAKIAETTSHITYKGVLVDTNKPIIVKIYKREFLNSPLIKRIKKDTTALTRLEHPSIPRLMDGDYGWQGYYFVREMVDGRSVSEMELPLDHETVTEVAVAVCDILSYAHGQGIVHGGISPNNIFATKGRGISLSDFCIKYMVAGPLEERAKLLLDSSAVYTAPEVILGSDPTVLSDIYQLGLVMYLMCTGELPFSAGASGIAGASSALTAEIKPPSSRNNKVPRYMDDIIMTCLNKDPLLRFKSADQLKESLNSKVLLLEKMEVFEMPAMPSISEEPEIRQEVPEPVRGAELPKKRSGIMKWIMFALWIAIISGIVYSLVNFFMFGD